MKLKIRYGAVGIIKNKIEIKRILGDQEDTLNNLKVKEIENRKKGELIYLKAWDLSESMGECEYYIFTKQIIFS